MFSIFYLICFDLILTQSQPRLRILRLLIVTEPSHWSVNVQSFAEHFHTSSVSILADVKAAYGSDILCHNVFMYFPYKSLLPYMSSLHFIPMIFFSASASAALHQDGIARFIRVTRRREKNAESPSGSWNCVHSASQVPPSFITRLLKELGRGLLHKLNSFCCFAMQNGGQHPSLRLCKSLMVGDRKHPFSAFLSLFQGHLGPYSTVILKHIRIIESTRS